MESLQLHRCCASYTLTAYRSMQPALSLICGGQCIKLLLLGWTVAALVILDGPYCKAAVGVCVNNGML